MKKLFTFHGGIIKFKSGHQTTYSGTCTEEELEKDGDQYMYNSPEGKVVLSKDKIHEIK
jgi:hypothetical protein